MPLPFLGPGAFGATLALRKYKIDEDTEFIVEIIGRRRGVVAWFLTQMGLDTQTTLRVTRERIAFRSAGFFGETYTTVPLTMVASTHCGYTKSAIALILGIVALILSILSGISANAGGFVLWLIITVVFFFVYWLSRKITIFLETSGSMVFGLSFKRSLIENVPVDIEQAIKTTELINRYLILAQQGLVEPGFPEKGKR